MRPRCVLASVFSRLYEWSLYFVFYLSDEAIDEESFGYLDLSTITTLIPRIGDRVKFIRRHNEFVSNMVGETVSMF